MKPHCILAVTKLKHMIERPSEMLAERLSEIKDEVTADDKKACMAALDITDPTITKYLSGTVSNPDLGLKMYEFFAGRIRERAERIKAVES